MPAENSPPQPPAPRQPTPAPWRTARLSQTRPQRLLFRFLGLPVLAVAGVLLYRGLQDRFVLPACDSSRAKDTLAKVLKQLKIEPLHFAPLETISSGKTQVVCKAALPLADGATLHVDYGFFWEGGHADMKYSVSRQAPQRSGAAPSVQTR